MSTKPTIQLKNAESALAETRARILTQLAQANRYNRHDAAHNLRCVLIVLDGALDPGPLRTRILYLSSFLYRAPRKRELLRAIARKNRALDRAA